MLPISPPSIIEKGIAIYCPPLSNSSTNLIRIDIYYSPNNPHLSWLTCETSKALIWTSTSTQTPEGILFLYQTLSDLDLGFYTIKITSVSKSSNAEGSITIGIIKPTPTLVIGLPYSTYPVISLS